jgi:hypothetical protein
MSPIPGEGHKREGPDLTTEDGRKVKLKIKGLEPRPKPDKTEERGAEEPPRDDPRPPVNPDVAGF